MRFLLGMCNHLQRAAVYLGRYTAVSFSAHILSRGAVMVYWQCWYRFSVVHFGHLLSGSTMRIAACGGFLFAPQDFCCTWQISSAGQMLLMLIYSLLFLAGIERGYPGQAGQAEFPYGVGRRIRKAGR